MRFFEQIPVVNYNGIFLRNIMLKSRILRDVLNNKNSYYPYVVYDGERPDTIAHDYYGDSNYDWLVLFSNNMIDPYHQWPLDYRDLIRHIEKKYGTTVDAQKSVVKHYRYGGIDGNIETTGDVARHSWTIPTETWSHLTPEEKSGWLPVYVYDWEVDENDAKRDIQLLDKVYLQQIRKELKNIFIDG